MKQQDMVKLASLIDSSNKLKQLVSNMYIASAIVIIDLLYHLYIIRGDLKQTVQRWHMALATKLCSAYHISAL